MKLTDLNAEIIQVCIGNDSVQAILFDCPASCGFKHMIPFWDNPAKLNGDDICIWHRTGGLTIDDLSVTPSYVSPKETPTRKPHIHIVITNGEF